MQHETMMHLAGGIHSANVEPVKPNPRSLLTNAVIAAPCAPGSAPGFIRIDARHDLHWVATSDPNLNHLIVVFAHASQLEDTELRAMIEETVAPQLKAALIERLGRDVETAAQPFKQTSR